MLVLRSSETLRALAGFHFSGVTVFQHVAKWRRRARRNLSREIDTACSVATTYMPLNPEQLTAIVDTREQRPLDLAPLKTIVGTLATGDYSLIGLENIVAVERKSLPDLIGCIGRDRKRFDAEIQRLLAYPARLIVVEGTLSQIQLKQYRGEVEPNSAIGSILGWMARGIPILFAGDHAEAGKMVSRFLFTVARRRYEEAKTLFGSVQKSSCTVSNPANQMENRYGS